MYHNLGPAAATGIGGAGTMAVGGPIWVTLAVVTLIAAVAAFGRTIPVPAFMRRTPVPATKPSGKRYARSRR